jgi:hypothetical protein
MYEDARRSRDTAPPCPVLSFKPLSIKLELELELGLLAHGWLAGCEPEDAPDAYLRWQAGFLPSLRSIRLEVSIFPAIDILHLHWCLI